MTDLPVTYLLDDIVSLPTVFHRIARLQDAGWDLQLACDYVIQRGLADDGVVTIDVVGNGRSHSPCHPLFRIRGGDGAPIRVVEAMA